MTSLIETKELTIQFPVMIETWGLSSGPGKDTIVRELAFAAVDSNPQVGAYIEGSLTYEVEEEPVIEIVGKRVELTNMVLIKAKLQAVPTKEVVSDGRS